MTIKTLLETEALCDTDVLILDEPEIHLHPMWQITFAHLIVLLQKAFDLSVIITTHSHFFVDAIDLYTTKYGIAGKTHYYLAEQRGERASFREVTDCKDALYEKMSDAVEVLNELRETLESGDEKK